MPNRSEAQDASTGWTPLIACDHIITTGQQPTGQLTGTGLLSKAAQLMCVSVSFQLKRRISGAGSQICSFVDSWLLEYAGNLNSRTGCQQAAELDPEAYTAILESGYDNPLERHFSAVNRPQVPVGSMAPLKCL